MDKLFIIGIKNGEIIKEIVEVVDKTDKTYYLGENKLGRKAVTKKQLNLLAKSTNYVGSGVNIVSTSKETAIRIFSEYVQEEIDKYCKMKEALFDKNSWIE